MTKYFLLPVALLISLMSSCRPSPKAEAVTPPLPEVNLYADYPKKQWEVSQLAEVVYIPLSKASFAKKISSYYSTFLGCVSENLIVSYTQGGDVEVFDHSGKKLGGFNRTGKSEEEYFYISSPFLDKERQEVWIPAAYQRFNVYALDGTFRRSVALSDELNAEVVADYSRDSLICYDDNRVSDGLNTNPCPFYFLSKEDGGIRKLTSIRVSQRLNNVERFVLNVGGSYQVVRYVVTTSPLVVGGGRAVLADYGQDTVFCHRQGKLTPLFVRTPSVYASLPFILTSMDFVTDRFLIFSFVEKVNAEDAFQRSLLYDFSDGGIYDFSIRNSDFEPALNLCVNMYEAHYPSNWLVNEMSADRFLQYYREGKLKGKAAEAASKMKSTDTAVLILYKFDSKN